MNDRRKKKVLFLITKSNWGEERILGASQDLAYYFWSLRTEIVTRLEQSGRLFQKVACDFEE